MKVILACERSAGHIFPAVCFGEKFLRSSRNAAEEKERGVYFFTTSPFIKKYIKDKNFKFIGKSFKNRNLLVECLFRPLEALYLILKIRPERVIGFGGRDSFFLVFFAAIFLIDTAIYEPNIEMGKANKVLAFFVHRVLRGFKSLKYVRKTTVLGIPLRENIRKIDKLKARAILKFDSRPVILCLGGSQGSEFVNNAFMKFVENSSSDYQIIHLTGKNDYSTICEYYEKIKKSVFVKDFYYDMEVLYSAADVAVSRAGANTLAEIAFYSLPAILIPLNLAGGHQKQNALYFKEKESAFLIEQKSFKAEDFKAMLEKLLMNQGFRENMADNLSGIKLGINFENFYINTYF